MRRFLTSLTAAMFAALLARESMGRPAAAEMYAANESLCEALATTPKPRTASDYRMMTDACAVAARWHETRAERARGAARQQQLILQATYLYFAAEGEAGSHLNGAAATVLKRARALYHDVFVNAANASLRSKARRGLSVVAEALSPTRPVR